MDPALAGLERIPPALLVLLAVISINLGSALAISWFPLYGTSNTLFLRMALGGTLLMLAYRHQLLPALRQSPGVILLLGVTIALHSGAFYEALAQWLDLNTWAAVALISAASLLASWAPSAAGKTGP